MRVRRTAAGTTRCGRGRSANPLHSLLAECVLPDDSLPQCQFDTTEITPHDLEQVRSFASVPRINLDRGHDLVVYDAEFCLSLIANFAI